MSSSQSTKRLAVWLIRGFALGGLVLASYLTWASWQSGSIVGCSGETYFSCEEVLGSKWSKWWGLPVSLLGAITYALMFAIAWVVPWQQNQRLSRAPRAAWLCLVALSFLAVGAAAWFILLQGFLLGEFCLYCCLVHVCSIAICLLVLWQLPRCERDQQYAQLGASLGLQSGATARSSATVPEGIDSKQIAVSLLIASIGWMALLAGQLLGTEETFIVETMSPGIRDTKQAEPNTSANESSATSTTQQQDIPSIPPNDAPNNAPDDAPEAVATDRVDKTDEITVSENETSNTSGAGPFPESSEFQVQPRVVHFQSSGMDIHLDRLPLLGNPQAEHVLVEFMDYTCQHCRHLNPMFDEAFDRYGKQMAVVVRPVALSHKCNPHMPKTSHQHSRSCDYAKLAIAVWHTEPEKFPEFHHWLMESEKIPSVYEAKSRALDLAGDDVLLNGIDSAAVRDMLSENNDTYHQFKKGLPVVLCDVGSFSGVPKSKEAFFEVLEKNLGFLPVQSALAK